MTMSFVRSKGWIAIAIPVALNGLAGGCAGDSPAPSDAGLGGSHDASAGAGGGTSGAGGAAATGGMGGTAGIVTGGGGFGGDLIPGDAPWFDGPCGVECFQPGGQICGRVADACRQMVECPPCAKEGFVCGGGGVHSVCGAPRDGGNCQPVQCQQQDGQYCGLIGGGCGDILDCGPCPAFLICGGGGTPGLCGWPDDGDCHHLTCDHQPSGKYCGIIGNACGGSIDCGTCNAGQQCGEVTDGVCNKRCPWCSQITHCEDGGATTVSGIALTAALASPHPLEGAAVFIPNLAAEANLPPISDSPACSACPLLVPDDVVAAAVTGPDGRFTLRDVPAGTGVPLVVQLGAWRRQTNINIVPCVDNQLPAGTVRLPRHQREGDIPLTAIATGGHDRMECLLRKMGIDDAEFTNPTGSGRIHLYRANGAAIDANTPDDVALKGSPTTSGSFARYRQVLLPCEGTEGLETPETLAHFTDYVNAGGRVLATHFSYVWLFKNGALGEIGPWTPGAPDPAAPLVANVATSVDRGMAFVTWLGLVGALSQTAPPAMQIATPHADLGTIVTGKGAEIWLSSVSPPTSQAVSVGTPVTSPMSPPDDACGRIVFTDFHATSASSPIATFPTECGPDAPFTTEEKALEFMLLNLFSCRTSKVWPRLLPAPPRPRVAPPPVPPRPPPPNAR